MKIATYGKARRRQLIITVLGITFLSFLILVNTADAFLPSEIPNSGSKNRVDFNGAWYIRGNALSQQDKYDEAIRAYDKANEANPYNSNGWSSKRLVRAKLSKVSNPNTPILTHSSTIPNTIIFQQTINPDISSQTTSQIPDPNISFQTTSPMSDTMTKLTASANKYTFGQILTLTATIDTPSQGVKKPSGTVNFIDGTLDIGIANVNSGRAILSTSSLSVGSHSITAQYSGDNNFNPSSSPIFPLMVLDKASPDKQRGSPENSMADTTTELTSMATEYVSGQLITFTAKVDTKAQETEKPSGTVNFIDGETQIGSESINSGQAIFTTSELSADSHSITAQYIGNNNFKPSTSPPFKLTVKKESIFHHPLFTLVCAIIATVVGGFIRTKLRL